MTVKDITKRILVGLLIVTMTLTYIPKSAFAVTQPVQDKPAAEATATEINERTRDAENEDLVNEAGSEDIKETSKPEAEESSEPEEEEAGGNASTSEEAAGEDSGSQEAVAFVRETAVDDVIVKVESEDGVFPEDAELIVEKADKADEAKATEAIDEIRPDKLNVADSYTFDIKVTDAEGNEIQPADGEKVNVSFSMARVADKNLSADVYHITENEVINKETKETETILEAEKLDADTDRKEATVTTETEGFSLYTVEFTYGELQYVMNGGSEVKASVIAKAVGLEGEIEDIHVSNEELFSASKESGEWIITSHKPFKTDEWMKVTIAGVVYEIIVTDAEEDIEVNTWSGMQEAINNIEDGKTIVLTDDLTASGGDERFAVIREGVSFTIDLKGHTINRNLSKDNDNNKGHVFDVNKGNVTIRDSAGGGKLTGGSDENGGGIVIGGDGTLNIEGVTISGNRATEDGGAIHVYGRLNMTGGQISGNTSETGGGISVHKSGTVTLNNVDIQNNTASSDGGGIAVKGRLNMKGASCMI